VGLLICRGALGLIVMLTGPVAVAPRLSVTFILNTNVPAFVGVPAIWLLLSVGAFVETRLRPGGSWPETCDHV
jgi:hypothetical protein